MSRALARLGLGALLLFTGTGHLSFLRREFVAQVPESLPLDPDDVVVASGFVGLGLASALIAAPPSQRYSVGLIVAAFFVAVFPGNVSQYVTRRSAFGLDTDNKRFARLFFQPVLVAAALWSAGVGGRRRPGSDERRERWRRDGKD
ncbi:MAG: hypothetical protein U0Q11_19730 [Vicinamibacterales bacterium]